MALVDEILASVDRGEDPELDKLVTKRADELGLTRREALGNILTHDEPLDLTTR